MNNLTVLIITYNEDPNIHRVLEKLRWAEKIVLLDSGSTDETLSIAGTFSNVEVVYRKFDSFAEQCNFGLSLIKTEWVLSLDADYVLTEPLIAEIKHAVTDTTVDAWNVCFRFCVYGYPLRSDNTTPRPILFRTLKGNYYNDGHAHRLAVQGKESNFKNKILHDDRKDLSRWFKNQDSYALKECQKLIQKPYEELRPIDKIRKLKWIAPFMVFFYSLFIKGLILDGWHGWYYTLQRTMVEIMFTLRLIEAEKINKQAKEYAKTK
ncbi:glycosyltransferase family 2 protein [Cytophaga hutchinsonii]|uniref:B-glycosyltransferase, glycosyltransferase family 2 protein n=1 Tax=Cytophaga hutchinsonii (strain ATCC 33406 / DSM 1761 / CIP 103989 / NBRC 15051 / NCIMB 9469 / D465) TaxID=269798 RepID=A0A6N4SPF6_CYTH3|nr:glycosyltransferase family 2 protein [Cytophaga hutchinsonii]ABG58177.1 b-glycosyltransferase, glycosyltransferase family 2 protein [Cytophaga hutchinsonii ATCC 33406]SFY02602.1 Glycosyltransferase involved in cell wall bisynthesis [Cytophaga hutchinsonii ATCC 33406]